MTEIQERIILAAIDEFGKKGLKFTMDDIAKNLAMSKKTLYTVYDSKEAILLCIVDYCFADIKRSEKAIAEDADMDIVTKIERILVVLPERYQNIGLNNLYQLRDKYPEVYKKVERYLSTDWNVTIDLIRQGIEQGVIRPIAIPVLQAMVEGTIQEFLANSILVENDISYEEAMREMAQMIVWGIKRRD